MDKRRPTYDLTSIQKAFSEPDRLRATTTATRDAKSLGFDQSKIVATIQSMEHGHFKKSMTAHGNSQLWQDVYYVPSEVGTLYIKFTAGVISEFLLLSFKEKT
ncbi:MAG: type II toxin-antitoxin system MqsR family toxin [Vulcanimicrobiota bacterium]